MKGQCRDCGATVWYRRSSKGRVIYHCSGQLEDKACQGRHTFGPRISATLLNQMKVQTHDEPKETSSPKVSPDPAGATPAAGAKAGTVDSGKPASGSAAHEPATGSDAAGADKPAGGFRIEW